QQDELQRAGECVACIGSVVAISEGKRKAACCLLQQIVRPISVHLFWVVTSSLRAQLQPLVQSMVMTMYTDVLCDTHWLTPTISPPCHNNHGSECIHARFQ